MPGQSTKFSNISNKKILSSLIQFFKEHHNLTKEDLLVMYEGKKELQIPVTIFSGKLSPLEALVTFLKEVKNLRFTEIASKLERDERSIWRTYHQAKKKSPLKFKEDKDVLTIPVSIFKKKKGSILECLVVYLKEEFNIPMKKVSLMLNKSVSTVWTVYHRAQKKSN